MPEVETGKLMETFSYYLSADNEEQIRWGLFENKDVAVFCSDDGLRAMAKAKILCGDGTFKACPRPYYQIFYIHCLYGEENNEGGEWVPVLMALMMGKEERQYEMIIEAIKDGWNKLNIKPEFKRIHLDYEVGLQNSFERLNGSDKVYGCVFHYTQNVIDQIRQLRLKDYYENKEGTHEDIRNYIRALIALPLIPKEHIKIMWNECLSKGPSKPSDAKDWPDTDLERLRKYMRNWIYKPKNRWSFWELGRCKSTNSAESYNSRLSYRYKQTPSCNKFLIDEQENFQNYDDRIKQIDNGVNKFKTRKAMYVEMDEKLKKFEQEYKDSYKEVSFSEFFLHKKQFSECQFG